MNRKVLGTCAALALAIAAGPALPHPGEGGALFAQERGRINGKVLDELTGAPIGGVLVSVVGTSIRDTTDDEGDFSLRRVPAGEHTLEVSHDEYGQSRHPVTLGYSRPDWLFAYTELRIRGRSPGTYSTVVARCDRLAAHPYDPERVAQGRPDGVIFDTEYFACQKASEADPENHRVRFQRYRALLLTADNPTSEAIAVSALEELAASGYVAARYALGTHFVRRQEGERAAEHFRPLVQAGDPFGLMGMGFLHEQGLGVAKDLDRAVALFRAAAEDGLPAAQTILGRAYLEGRHVAADPVRAAALLARAAEAGDPDAQALLGFMYLDGRGVPVDTARAVRMFEQVAERDPYWGRIQALAEFQLGSAYLRGAMGVPQDDEKALEAFRRASEHGDERAKIQFATMVADGIGWPRKDPDGAAVMLRHLTWTTRSPEIKDIASAIHERITGSPPESMDVEGFLSPSEQLRRRKQRALTAGFTALAILALLNADSPGAPSTGNACDPFDTFDPCSAAYWEYHSVIMR